MPQTCPYCCNPTTAHAFECIGEAARNDQRADELATAEQHEEILAGLANERAHSRFYDANGQPVQWTYTGKGRMSGPEFEELMTGDWETHTVV